jgi:predicted nucleic acid-binding protein
VAIVVSDAGPPHYLVLINAIDLLPRLFGKVVIPDIVYMELSRARTPAPVRAWLATSPSWFETRSAPSVEASLPVKLGEGEQAVIVLAGAIGADVVLMDDRAGVAAARLRGFLTTGTLGVLERAASKGFIDLPDAVVRLKATNFRYSPILLDSMLVDWRKSLEK